MAGASAGAAGRTAGGAVRASGPVTAFAAPQPVLAPGPAAEVLDQGRHGPAAAPSAVLPASASDPAAAAAAPEAAAEPSRSGWLRDPRYDAGLEELATLEAAEGRLLAARVRVLVSLSGRTSRDGWQGDAPFESVLLDVAGTCVLGSRRR